ncbi:MAG: hypothetical protein ABIR91_05950 [Candidatus Saccharimonadales bacterium]
MTRKRIIIIAIAAIVLLTIGTIASVMNKPVSTPTTSTESDEVDTGDQSSQPATDTPTESTQAKDIEPDYTPESMPSLILDGVAVNEGELYEKYATVAERAAVGYVNQSSTESSKDRRVRLQKLFEPNSPIIAAPKPAVDPTRSSDTTSKAGVISSNIHVEGNRLMITVALRITTYKTKDSSDQVSIIHQAYDVGFIAYNGTYKPSTMELNTEPIVTR